MLNQKEFAEYMQAKLTKEALKNQTVHEGDAVLQIMWCTVCGGSNAVHVRGDLASEQKPEIIVLEGLCNECKFLQERAPGVLQTLRKMAKFWSERLYAVTLNPTVKEKPLIEEVPSVPA